MKIKNKWIQDAKINSEEYISMYEESIFDNENFWKKQADRIDWIKKFTKIKEITYSKKKCRY